MTITTATSGDFNDNKKGLNNATLKMVGSDRIFFINDGSVEKELILVNLNELNLKGSATKLNDGGLIYNREALNIQYSRLTSGNATRGGGYIMQVFYLTLKKRQVLYELVIVF
jgi:hypothetical protein